MEVLSMVLIGLMVGIVSKMVMPGRGGPKWMSTMTMAVLGSLAVGMSTRGLGWFEPDQTTGLLASMVGAITVVVCFRLLMRPRAQERKKGLTIEG